jgi:drug/metabolite transporter (DMT)-like permease
MTERQATLRGILLTLVSSILFAFTNAGAKWVMGDIPTGELLWVRSVVAFSLVSLFIRRSEWAMLFAPGQRRFHVLRMAASAIEVVCFYWAISSTPLADMTAIYLASPIYVTGMAALFLREPVGLRRWTAVLVGFVGVLVAVRPSAGSVSAPVLVAVGGSLLYATSLVVTRRLRGTPSTLLVATQMAALFVLTSASSTLGWVIPRRGELILMVAVGVVSMIAFWCVNEGLRLARASAVAPFNYSSIVWATLLGYVIFGDMPATMTLAGAAIIIAAGLLIMLREDQVRRTVA